MEDVREGTPAAVAGEHSLLGVPRLAAFVFDLPKRADRGDVVAGLFLQPALPDAVRLGYPEVARRRRGRRFRCDVPEFEFPDDRFAVGGRSPLSFSLGGSAHSCVASSHAAG